MGQPPRRRVFPVFAPPDVLGDDLVEVVSALLDLPAE
jgi:hypothetical protein